MIETVLKFILTTDLTRVNILTPKELYIDRYETVKTNTRTECICNVVPIKVGAHARNIFYFQLHLYTYVYILRVDPNNRLTV
jgi:hypothetical protein